MAQSGNVAAQQAEVAGKEPIWNQEELRRLIECTGDASFVLEASGRAISVHWGTLGYGRLPADGLAENDYRRHIVHPDDLEAHRETMARCLAAGAAFALEERMRDRDGKYRWFLIRYRPFPDEQGAPHRWYVSAVDIDGRRQTEALRSAEKQALEMVADGSTLEAVLDHLCGAIDAQIAPSVATILLMDADGKKLWPTAGPLVRPEWRRAISPLPVSEEVGLCGTAAYRKERVVVANIATEPTFREEYRQAALRNGILAAWSEPILTKAGDVLGTFAIYSSDSRVPGASDLALIEDAGRIARIAIERQRAHAALAMAQSELESERDRLRLLLEVQGSLVSNLDLRGLLMGLAGGLRRVTECDFIGLSVPGESEKFLRQHFAHYFGDPGNIREGMAVPIHGSASGKAFRTRALVCLDDPDANRPDPAIYGSPEGAEFYRFLLSEGVPAGYFLPLCRGETVIGVLQLTKYAGKALKPQAAQFLTGLASQLSTAVSNALEHESVVASREQLAREQVYLREEIVRSSMFEEIVGSSQALRRILDQVSRVAPTDSTVLIQGETGTGKELLARAIHSRSRRASRPFVRMNCAAIPPALIASELFGHEKGAFTGALQRRVGRFESADGGTIFLDEVGEIPQETQIALLRVLQEREFERVGGCQTIRVDVRVLAATNRDLQRAVEAGQFRRDLFYRLNVFPLAVPPLRDRGDDIPLLVEYLVDRYAKQMGKQIGSISRRTLEAFQGYDWPGNIRELQNVIERAVILCDGPTFSVDPTWLGAGRKPGTPGGERTDPFDEQERLLIETALREADGRISGPAGAATKLGIPRQTLESKMKKLGIDRYPFKRPVL